jgi:hypothetical protein
MDCNIASGAAEAFPGGQPGVAEFAAGAAGQLSGRRGLQRVQLPVVGGNRLLQPHHLSVGQRVVVGAGLAETSHRLGGGQERSYRVFHNTNFRTIATLFEKKVPNVDNFFELGACAKGASATAEVLPHPPRYP